MKWLPSILVMIIIFLASATSGQTIDAVGLGNEALHINGHFILFFLLCVSFYKATKNIFVSVVLTIVYAFSDEWHQSFTPSRAASFFDIYVDTAAALVAGGILWKFNRILPKKLKNWLHN